MSLDYKLSDMEKKDLISCCTINGIHSYKLTEITPLPYGYLFCFGDENRGGNAFVVNIYNNGKEIEVLPQCDFADRVKCIVKDYFEKHKEYK